MDTAEIIAAALGLIAGVGIFILACHILTTNVEAISGKQMKKMFSKASKRKLYGVGIGAATTGVIQSSAATIVLAIGFVNAGIMSMALAASIVYGANIGTTITAWIAAIGTVNAGPISLTIILAALTGVGVFLWIFSKKDSTKAKAMVIASLGMIFVALGLMATAMSELAMDDQLKDFISGIDNFLVLIIIGFVITALTQSSSVTTALLITMLPIAGATTGLIDLEQAIYITLGSNIGSCVIVLISGFTGTTDAKRLSLIQLFFNLFGVILFVVVEAIMKTFGVSYSDIFSNIFVGNAGLELAAFHTSFNVIMTIIMLPLTGAMMKFVDNIMKDKGEKDGEPHLFYLNKYMLRNPPIAVHQLKSEVLNMATIAITNFQLSFKMIKNQNFDEKETFMKNEDTLDFLNQDISHYLVRFAKLTLSRRDRLYVGSVHHTITDLERIGDHAVNIMQYAERMEKKDSTFSDEALEEISTLGNMVMELYDKVINAYTMMSADNLDEAYEIEDSINRYVQKVAENHIERLNSGKCKLDVGSDYLSLSSDIERIADHLINMADTVKELSQK